MYFFAVLECFMGCKFENLGSAIKALYISHLNQIDASESFEYDRLFIHLRSFCFRAYLTFLGCCTPNVFFCCRESERKSKKDERSWTCVWTWPFFFYKSRKLSRSRKKKNKRHVFHLCFEVKFNIFFIIYLPTLYLGVITFFFLFFKSLKCDSLSLLYGLAA